MALLTETQLVYLFAGLLAIGSVVLLFIPLLRRAWSFAASPLGFALVALPILAVSIAAIALVALAISDPTYFLPVLAVTVGMRIASPAFIYRRVRDWFEGKRGWAALRLLVLAAFLGLAGYLAYHLVVLASGQLLTLTVVLSESLIMALGAASAIVRFALRVRPPKEKASLWPLWLSAILFASAFVVVAPYAFPEFAIFYTASGIVGWIVGSVVLWYDW